MSQILRCDWLPDRARLSYLARWGLPVARPLGVESLIPTTMQSFLRFSHCFGGKSSLKSSVNSQHLPRGKEIKRMESFWCGENFVSATMNECELNR